jgi:hypothetical protein
MKRRGRTLEIELCTEDARGFSGRAEERADVAELRCGARRECGLVTGAEEGLVVQLLPGGGLLRNRASGIDVLQAARGDVAAVFEAEAAAGCSGRGVAGAVEAAVADGAPGGGGVVEELDAASVGGAAGAADGVAEAGLPAVGLSRRRCARCSPACIRMHSWR